MARIKTIDEILNDNDFREWWSVNYPAIEMREIAQGGVSRMMTYYAEFLGYNPNKYTDEQWIEFELYLGDRPWDKYAFLAEPKNIEDYFTNRDTWQKAVDDYLAGQEENKGTYGSDIDSLKRLQREIEKQIFRGNTSLDMSKVTAIKAMIDALEKGTPLTVQQEISVEDIWDLVNKGVPEQVDVEWLENLQKDLQKTILEGGTAIDMSYAAQIKQIIDKLNKGGRIEWEDQEKIDKIRELIEQKYSDEDLSEYQEYQRLWSMYGEATDWKPLDIDDYYANWDEAKKWSDIYKADEADEKARAGEKWKPEPDYRPTSYAQLGSLGGETKPYQEWVEQMFPTLEKRFESTVLQEGATKGYPTWEEAQKAGGFRERVYGEWLKESAQKLREEYYTKPYWERGERPGYYSPRIRSVSY